MSSALPVARRHVSSPAYGLSSLLVLLCAVLTANACSAPTDVDPLAPHDDRPFYVLQAALPISDIEAQPLNPRISLTFSDFPDPDTVRYPTVRLGPRGASVESLAELRLVERQMVLSAKNLLLPETDYFVEITQALRALSGQPLLHPYRMRFHTVPVALPPPPPEPEVTLADVLGAAGQLGARCALPDCHSSTGGKGPARGLDLGGSIETVRQRLVNIASRGSPERLFLVQPGQPARSYLLRKLVADYGFVRVEGSRMPPPPLPALENAALLAIERWIVQGAR